jgi:hypothetical protein
VRSLPGLAQTGGWRSGRVCPLCPGISDIDLFRYRQSIVYFDPEISDRAFDLGVAKQKLDSSEIAGATVDQGSLRASERMRSEKPGDLAQRCLSIQRRGAHILSRRHTAFGAKTTSEQELAGSFVGDFQIVIDCLAGGEAIASFPAFQMARRTIAYRPLCMRRCKIGAAARRVRWQSGRASR